MNLADNLKKIRKDNNLSQEQLAEKLGVSRQAVSKWESGISYPEMDKVIQICNLFNLNINELINEDIKEVTETKEAQVRNNKYIDSFFEYITKTIDMFSSMKFKQKIKCLFEQCVISLILFIVLLIIGAIGRELVWAILQLLPESLYYPMYRILEVLYIIMAMVVGGAVLLHIFKIRYLDYYEIVKEPKDTSIEEIVTEVEAKVEESQDNKKNRIILEKKKEKIVIRDPKHSEYKFFNGIGKLLLWFLKFIACLVLGCFVITLIALVMCLPISFLVFKSGLLFVGLILGVIGGILLNIILLELIYNFIVSKKWHKTRIFIMSIISIIVYGIGLGMTCVSATEFNIVSKEYDLVESKYTYDMVDSLVLDDFGYYDSEIEYIEKNVKGIEIVVKHSDMYFSNMWKDGNVLDLIIYTDDSKIPKYLRSIIDDINHKEIAYYDYQVEVYVYGTKANLDKIRSNSKDYNSRIQYLEEQLQNARDSYRDASYEVDRLRQLIINSEADVIFDRNGNIIEIRVHSKEE